MAKYTFDQVKRNVAEIDLLNTGEIINYVYDVNSQKIVEVK